jgi:hypothetical protein
MSNVRANPQEQTEGSGLRSAIGRLIALLKRG